MHNLVFRSLDHNEPSNNFFGYFKARRSLPDAGVHVQLRAQRLCRACDRVLPQEDQEHGRRGQRLSGDASMVRLIHICHSHLEFS